MSASAFVICWMETCCCSRRRSTSNYLSHFIPSLSSEHFNITWRHFHQTAFSHKNVLNESFLRWRFDLWSFSVKFSFDWETTLMVKPLKNRSDSVWNTMKMITKTESAAADRLYDQETNHNRLSQDDSERTPPTLRTRAWFRLGTFYSWTLHVWGIIKLLMRSSGDLVSQSKKKI